MGKIMTSSKMPEKKEILSITGSRKLNSANSPSFIRGATSTRYRSTAISADFRRLSLSNEESKF